MLANGFAIVWSLLVSIFGRLLKLIPSISPELQRQLRGRSLSVAALKELALARNNATRCYTYFCSSAGEYEQALPVIERLTAQDPKTLTVVFAFSASLIEYAAARGERTRIVLAPFDTVWNWGSVFAALRPTATVVVRHELWPAFLAVAKNWAPLYLIDGQKPVSTGKLNLLLKRFLLRTFNEIFLLSDADRQFFLEQRLFVKDRLHVVGDTKYDRAFERSRQQLPTDVATGLKTARKKLIIGSAYQEEIDMTLTALQESGDGLLSRWQVVIAPHKPNDAIHSHIETVAEKQKLSVGYFTKNNARDSDIIVLDRFGILAEAYAACDIALVGGALSNQVHNVLEPAIRGLPVAFGPKHHNSQEAGVLLEKGLAQVVKSPAELASWWRKVDEKPNSHEQEQVALLCGAADQIFRKLAADTSDPNSAAFRGAHAKR
jgi:3-deoxy-D-manno-octulosonic-acid transferase